MNGVGCSRINFATEEMTGFCRNTDERLCEGQHAQHAAWLPDRVVKTEGPWSVCRGRFLPIWPQSPECDEEAGMQHDVVVGTTVANRVRAPVTVRRPSVLIKWQGQNWQW